MLIGLISADHFIAMK